MITYFKSRSKSLPYRVLSVFVAFTFSFSCIVPPSSLYAQGLPATVMNLPVPGTPVPLTPGFTPARIIGMTIHADNPLMFDFMVDPGDMKLNDQQTQDESLKLVKYFLASLTVPAEKLWVNLSPYEKDKIVPEEFGQTEMGAELLAQDYMLKQLTASLMNPEDELGKKFWDRVYEKAQKLFGTTEIPLNTFNKVWIVPEKAVVYANGLNVFILESRFKVMMEEDYLALQYHAAEHPDASSKDAASGISSSIIKEVLLPEIEKEVNEGKTFANLRQIHNSLILAAWYKQNLKESLLGQIYADKAKTGGLTVQDTETSRKIYNQYVEAFQKGVHNFIKEDYDPATKQIIPRKYFSGGVTEAKLEIEDKTLPDPEVLKTFAVSVAGASVITAGVKSPGEEISFKMPFPKTTPSAASPVDDDYDKRRREEVAYITNRGRALRGDPDFENYLTPEEREAKEKEKADSMHIDYEEWKKGKRGASSPVERKDQLEERIDGNILELGSRSLEKRKEAASELGDMGAVVKDRVFHLLKAESFVFSEDDMVYEAVSRSGRIPRAVISLIKLLKNEKDIDVRITAVWALGQIGDKRAEKTLTALAKDKDLNLRANIAHALGEIGETSDAKDVLIKLKNDKDSFVRGIADKAFEKFSARDRVRSRGASSPVSVSEWIEKTLAGEENIDLPAALLEAEKQKREYVIGGNWKMAVETEDKAVELIRDIAQKLNVAVAARGLASENLDIVIAVAPSFVHLPAVRRELKRLEDNGELLKGLIALGAQDVSAYDPGARTSETSAKQLADLGIRYVIIGHSERRRGAVRETSRSVNAKVKKALETGLIPIIAVGETLEEREAGRTFDVLRTQFLESTADLTAGQMKDVIIAYEPVWAIGTGKTATPEEADKAQRFLRALALNQHGPSAAGALRIQYGGSMNAANIESLIQKYNIDGGLIGGAALKADDFIEIVVKSLEHYLSASSPVVVEKVLREYWEAGENRPLLLQEIAAKAGLDKELILSALETINNNPNVPFSVEPAGLHKKLDTETLWVQLIARRPLGESRSPTQGLQRRASSPVTTGAQGEEDIDPGRGAAEPISGEGEKKQAQKAREDYQRMIKELRIKSGESLDYAGENRIYQQKTQKLMTLVDALVDSLTKGVTPLQASHHIRTILFESLSLIKTHLKDYEREHALRDTVLQRASVDDTTLAGLILTFSSVVFRETITLANKIGLNQAPYKNELEENINSIHAVDSGYSGPGVEVLKEELTKSLQTLSSSSPLNEGPEKKGGIDLNPGNMDLQTNYGADRIRLPMPDIPLENIKIDGLVPFIIHVAPVVNLPLLLGLADEPEADDAAGFQPQHSPADAPRRFKAREVEEIGLLN